MIRVLVADDQALVRGGFRMILDAQEDISVVGEAADGAEAIELARLRQAEVVLMDVRMPGLDGIEATRRLLAGGTAARVLVLTTFDLDEYVYEAIRAGASGFLLENAPQSWPRPSARSRPATHRWRPRSPAACWTTSPAGHRPAATLTLRRRSSPAGSARCSS